MAEKALKKVEEQLNCSICLDTYTDPKLLQCFHVYCRKCLVKLVVRDQQGQLTLTCPTCRQVTPVPPNGVAGLQSAFHINHLLEIVDEHKKATDPSAIAGVESDSKSLTPHQKATIFCPEHDGKEVELYCETCGELICLKCGIKGGKHNSHDCKEINEAFERYKEEIIPSLEPVENQLTTINQVLAQLDTQCVDVSDQQVTIEADINNSIQQLHEVLDVRKTELISQLQQITQEKLKGLAAQRDQIETTQAQLSSCLDFMKESLRTGSQREVLRMKTTIVKQVKELTTFQSVLLMSNTKANVGFSAPTNMTAACQNYGQVAVSSLLDPSKCHATGKGLEIAIVGEKSTAVLQAIDVNGQPSEEPIKSSECELMLECRARGSVMKIRQSQYEISYKPTIKGKHQLHIKVEGHHIRGSPFSVVVRSPVEKLSTPSLTIDSVEEPWTVALNKKGEVVVTEFSGHCVSIFSPSGEKLLSFGKLGSNNGEFEYPRGVEVDDEGNILVTDSFNHRIQKFTADGHFLTAVGTYGSGSLQFCQPKGISVNTVNKKVYIGDVRNHRIHVLNHDLTFSSTFGKEGSDKGQFDSPCGIACDNTGKVYVADGDNHRIQVFTAKGKFLRMFGRHGEGRGELNWPVDIAVDTSGLIHVIESKNHRISVFTSDGQFVTSFGRKGKEPGEFNGPRGLAVNNSGVMYVCDSLNNRIQVFK